MSVAEINTSIIERFLICKGLTPLAYVAEEIGISTNTLRRWINGKPVNMRILQRIETWTEQNGSSSHATRA